MSVDQAIGTRQPVGSLGGKVMNKVVQEGRNNPPLLMGGDMGAHLLQAQ